MIHRSDVAFLPGMSAFVIKVPIAASGLAVRLPLLIPLSGYLSCKRGAFRVFHNRVTPIYVDVADYEVRQADGGDEEEQVVLTDSHYPELNFHLPLSQVLPVRECEFEGRTFHCPHNPDFVLTQQFGSDWRTPKQNFKPFMAHHTNDTS
jgi:hypothetical protein